MLSIVSRSSDQRRQLNGFCLFNLMLRIGSVEDRGERARANERKKEKNRKEVEPEAFQCNKNM
jgi:hypothetical protein